MESINNNQVKIRGYRIELEEIEAYLNQFEGIKQSVVVATKTSKNDKVLEVFFTSGEAIDKQTIIDYLSEKLPAYMVPSIYKRVEEFVHTANGKIDRKRILECIEVESKIDGTQQNNKNELSDIQNQAFEVILSNLNEKEINNISIDTDFVSIGIDSITFIKIVVALESEFDFEFDDEMLLITKFSTLKSMIDYVESKCT